MRMRFGEKEKRMNEVYEDEDRRMRDEVSMIRIGLFDYEEVNWMKRTHG